MFFIKNKIPKYDLIWYLTAPYNTRLERHESQVKNKENPDGIKVRFPGKIFFNNMESILKKLLNAQNKIEGEFDTTVLSYEEIVVHINDKIKNSMTAPGIELKK